MQYLCAIKHLHTTIKMYLVVNVAALFLGGIFERLVNKKSGINNSCRNYYGIYVCKYHILDSNVCLS